MARVLTSLLLMLTVPAWAATPAANLRISPGPYYLEVPVQLAVSISGMAESPQPEISSTPVSGGELRQVSFEPRVRSSVQVINGKVSRSREVSFVARYMFTPAHSGRLTLGPFTVTQGQQSVSTDTVTLDIGEVPDSEEQHLKLLLPERPLWVGERVPVTIEWWVSESLAERIASRDVQVPLFDLTDSFKFEAGRGPPGRNTLTVRTRAGRVELPASVRQAQADGRDYLVLSAERTMTPLVETELDLAPATILVEEAIRWDRNLFGERVATQVRRIRAQSEPVRLVVKKPPPGGQPASFAEIVGSGFRIAVSAERSVVNVGDPITLEVAVSGNGALDTLALPHFEALGLPATDFRTPAARVAGHVGSDGVKRFRFDVRARHAGVDAIPALQLSWFDAATARYETTRSEPIALSVRQAERVGASDVVVRASDTGSAEPPDAQPASRNAQSSPSIAPPAVAEFSNLAIETRLERLVPDTPRWYASTGVHVAGYLTGAAMMLLAWLWRRDRNRDPDGLRLREAVQLTTQRIRGARGASEVSDAIRALVVQTGAENCRDALEALLARCDAVAFGRQPGNTDELDGLRQSALSLVPLLAGPR